MIADFKSYSFNSVFCLWGSVYMALLLFQFGLLALERPS